MPGLQAEILQVQKFFPFTQNLPITLDVCWHCKRSESSLLHAWWHCPGIQAFWEEVQRVITQVTSYTLDFTTAQHLLHHTCLSHRQYFKSQAMHIINTARMCIPVHGKSIQILHFQTSPCLPLNLLPASRQTAGCGVVGWPVGGDYPSKSCMLISNLSFPVLFFLLLLILCLEGLIGDNVYFIIFCYFLIYFPHHRESTTVAIA